MQVADDASHDGDELVEDDVAALRAFRALKMRYHRSVRNAAKCPAEIRQMVADAKHDPKKRTQLFEMWVQASENWNETSIVISSKTEKTKKLRGTYKLMSRDEPCMRYYTFSYSYVWICFVYIRT